MNRLPRHRLLGLTVIEAMVTVLVLGVLIAVAAPSMQGLIAQQRVKGINAELVTDLQFARSEAARRNVDVFMRFRDPDNCYVAYVDAAGPGTCDCTLTPGNVCSGGREEIKTVKVPTTTGVAVAASSATGRIIRFERLSGSSAPDEFRVSVESATGGKLRTVVNAAGRPSVCSPDASVNSVLPC
jgi:type IV fimbrial biogenesis protein FimT